MIKMSAMPVPVYLFKLSQLFHRPHLNVTNLEMGKEKNNLHEIFQENTLLKMTTAAQADCMYMNNLSNHLQHNSFLK